MKFDKVETQEWQISQWKWFTIQKAVPLTAVNHRTSWRERAPNGSAIPRALVSLLTLLAGSAVIARRNPHIPGSTPNAAPWARRARRARRGRRGRSGRSERSGGWAGWAGRARCLRLVASRSHICGRSSAQASASVHVAVIAGGFVQLQGRSGLIMSAFTAC